MKKINVLRVFSDGVGIYLIILILDFLIELLIKGYSGTISTIFGVTVKTIFNAEQQLIQVTMTSRVMIFLVIFLGILIAGRYLWIKSFDSKKI
ncbi:hypothetical protein [Companilactobacillus mishanensis]|uniref:Uncharacterized protein n=1 Tax=Companilactobacillus mishanensis TaxID=2486008 RepID=A0A5P0ZIE5_9LACO|nr:hypothetical protein [Companilactobacillus mishanensis]MQS52840.1 hypothetical protein [Companilactobacillus mishanensis]